MCSSRQTNKTYSHWHFQILSLPKEVHEIYLPFFNLKVNFDASIRNGKTCLVAVGRNHKKIYVLCGLRLKKMKTHL